MQDIATEVDAQRMEKYSDKRSNKRSGGKSRTEKMTRLTKAEREARDANEGDMVVPEKREKHEHQPRTVATETGKQEGEINSILQH